MTLYLPDSCGWGNVLLLVCDAICHQVENRVYKDIIKYECGAFDWTGFNVTLSKEDDPHNSKLIINPHTHQTVNPNISRIIKPTKLMEECLEKYKHGCKWGMHIRRGAFSKDSENMGCHGLDENGNIKKAFFANDIALEKFKKVIETNEGKFFLASDSMEIKEMFKQLYPDRVVTLDNSAVLTYECKFLNNTVSEDDRFKTYLEWFLLSQCSHIFITGGNKDMTDFSTFGYTAACYSGADISLVTNV